MQAYFKSMKMGLMIIALLLLTACAARWSAVAPNGSRFQDIEPLCRAQARESARHQLPFYFDRDYGPAGFPPDTRRDIEERETAWCLKQHGFTLTREWR